MGSPRLFLNTRGCKDLVDELRAAPLQPIDKKDGGEKIDPEWESRHGHAVAMARYAVMSRPEASTAPPRQITDVRREFVHKHQERIDKETDEARKLPRLLAYFT